MPEPLPPKNELTIQFAHGSYHLAERFVLRGTGIAHFQTWTEADTIARLGEAHVLMVSGMWRDEMLAYAGRLRLIQISAAGFDQFDQAALAARGVRLASGSGLNKDAVSEHAIGLMLAITRRLASLRDEQRAHRWRGVIPDLDAREEELGGRTIVIYGMGAIGARLARLARAFGMRVIGIKRDVARHGGDADEVRAPEAFLDALGEADFVVLTCPLTPETTDLIDARALAAMRPHAYLVNVARGGCVDEDALVAALESRRIAGAALDVARVEPLPPDSPLWDLPNVIITPHTAGETRRYEDNAIAILLENLERMWRGESELVNQVV